jgi:formiminoglutamase
MLSSLINRLNFSPFEAIAIQSNWLEVITGNFENKIDWQEADIAIIGIDEQGATRIRERFFRLKKGAIQNYKVVDLGNIILTQNKDKQLIISKLCRILMENNVFPLLIGMNNEDVKGQFWAYSKEVNLAKVACEIDFETRDKQGNYSQLEYLLQSKSPKITQLYHLGHQEYLCQRAALNYLASNNSELWSLGKIQDSLRETEPLIRSSNLFSFDLSAITQSQSPATNNPQAFGLTAREACQLSWYAGTNVGLKSASFCNYSPQKDDNKQTAAVVATMMWYLIEGFYYRRKTLFHDKNSCDKYKVAITEELTLVFYKNKFNEKWWLEINENKIIPCSYQDYVQASKGDLPQRWIKNN